MALKYFSAIFFVRAATPPIVKVLKLKFHEKILTTGAQIRLSLFNNETSQLRTVILQSHI